MINAESKKVRYLFLDNIKVLFTVLVIFWHVSVTYMEAGWWYYKEISPIDPVSNIIFLFFTSLAGVFQASLLGLFFLLGGYFTPKSYDRKGIWSFWKERLIRLGIPLFLYVLLINPIMIYALAIIGIPPWNSLPMLQGTFIDYYLSRFISWGNFIDFISFGGPMWFLRVLLIFTAIYTLWRQITKLNLLKQKIPKQLLIPKYLYLLLIAIGLGCLTFVVRIFLPIDDRPLEIPWGQLIQYLLMFSIGVISVRYLWFEKMTKKHVKMWLITIIIALVIIYIDFMIAILTEVDLIDFTGGANYHSFLMSLVDNIICMGVIFILIKVFYAKFNKQGTILRNLSTSAYHMYLVHPPVLLVLSLSLASLTLHPLIKMGIVFPSAVLICYLISHYVLQKIKWKRHDKNTQKQ